MTTYASCGTAVQVSRADYLIAFPLRVKQGAVYLCIDLQVRKWVLLSSFLAGRMGLGGRIGFIDGDPLNCRRENLVEADAHEKIAKRLRGKFYNAG